MTAPQPDRPHYSQGTPVPTGTVDASTAEASRGTHPATGAKTTEPPEPAPTFTSVTPATGPAAGGTAVVLAGDNLGGSTGVTVGGAAATGFAVDSETRLRFTTPPGTAGARNVVILNVAGNTTAASAFTYA